VTKRGEVLRDLNPERTDLLVNSADFREQFRAPLIKRAHFQQPRSFVGKIGTLWSKGFDARPGPYPRSTFSA
jgi:hypothetical protein